MGSDHPHPLLAQVPLTVSPFVNLPTSTMLPYTYKTLPSILPPSRFDLDPEQLRPPQMILENWWSNRRVDRSELNDQQTHTTATSSEQENSSLPQNPYILANEVSQSTIQLCSFLENAQVLADHSVNEWLDQIKKSKLNEQQKLAPGWLDVEPEKRMLVPVYKTKSAEKNFNQNSTDSEKFSSICE